MSSPLASAANAAGKPQVVKKKREAQIEKDSGDEAEEWLREFFDRRGDESAHETSAGAASAKSPSARSPKRSPRSMLSRRRRGVGNACAECACTELLGRVERACGTASQQAGAQALAQAQAGVAACPIWAMTAPASWRCNALTQTA
jgi:hypothetical protein